MIKMCQENDNYWPVLILKVVQKLLKYKILLKREQRFIAIMLISVFDNYSRNISLHNYEHLFVRCAAGCYFALTSCLNNCAKDYVVRILHPSLNLSVNISMNLDVIMDRNGMTLGLEEFLSCIGKIVRIVQMEFKPYNERFMPYLMEIIATPYVRVLVNVCGEKVTYP